MGIRVKALSFEFQGRKTYGVQTDDGIFEAAPGFRESHSDLRAVIETGSLGRLEQSLQQTVVDENAIRYLPVIVNPDKVICIGVNYRPHVEEMGREVPEHPLVFVRFAGSQVGHRERIIRPSVSTHYDFEGELAVIIGSPARQVSRSEAMSCVAGYACFMDGTVRDWQKHTTQFTPGKNFDRSGALGPWLVTADEVGDVASLELTTTVNGNVMQSGRVADLIFDIPALIEYCSTFTALLPGDVIATGTPGGVGAARKPPVWLSAGDTVAVDLGTVGRLENTVAEQ